LAAGDDAVAVHAQRARLARRHRAQPRRRLEQRPAADLLDLLAVFAARAAALAVLLLVALDLVLDDLALVRDHRAARDLDREDPRLGVVALRGEELLAGVRELVAVVDPLEALLRELVVLGAQILVDAVAQVRARPLVEREEASPDDRDGDQ